MDPYLWYPRFGNGYTSQPQSKSELLAAHIIINREHAIYLYECCQNLIKKLFALRTQAPKMPPHQNLSPRRGNNSEPQLSTASKTLRLPNGMYLPRGVVFGIILVAFIAYSLYTKYVVNPQDEENPRRGRSRRRRRGTEWLCPGCESLMIYQQDDETTPLLVRRECGCGTRGLPPSYGARDQLPKYTDGDMAPPYEE